MYNASVALTEHVDCWHLFGERDKAASEVGEDNDRALERVHKTVRPGERTILLEASVRGHQDRKGRHQGSPQQEPLIRQLVYFDN